MRLLQLCVPSLWLIVNDLVISGMTSPERIRFKPYSPNQAMLLPPSLDEMIATNHPVRVVNRVINQIDIRPLIRTYKGGGSSSYHPRMLLKVLIYAYLRNIYSSRQMEDSLRENIYFMWLSGMNQPDHNTINRFRGKRLEGHLKDIFSAVVVLLAEEGHMSIREVFCGRNQDRGQCQPLYLCLGQIHRHPETKDQGPARIAVGLCAEGL